ncbi:MAG: ABC transporter ATP-binding protein [Anaerolineales bacterium]|nr:ABC transporter ATP-binding protein [Anaerolineales bacterium]
MSKRYGDLYALRNLSVDVPDGSVFGLLGPNGAGKTTLLRIIVRFLYPDTGQIDLTGCTFDQIGYLPERPHFPRRFKIKEYLHIAAQASGLDRETPGAIASALNQTGLSQVSDWRISTCSKGMLQRLGLAQALLTNPKLLLMDEPFSGLDPAAQAAMRKLIHELNKIGKTIVISTHQLADVTQMCSHMAILSNGQLASSGPLSDMLVSRPQVIISVNHLPESISSQILDLHPSVIIEGMEIILPGEAIQSKLAALRFLLDAGIEIQGLRQQKTTLEEIYMNAVRNNGLRIGDQG